MNKYHRIFVLAFMLIFFDICASALDVSAKQGNFSIEAFAGGGFGPEDQDTGANFGSTLGGGVGVGYEVVDNLQLRADLGLYKWKDKVAGTFRTCPNPYVGGCGNSSGTIEEKLQNMPLFIGGRYLFRVNPKVTPFVDLGASLNFQKAKQEGDLVCSGCQPFPAPFHFSESTRASNIGVVPGFGIQVMLLEHLDIGAVARYYLIGKGVGDANNLDSKFLSLGFFISYKL